MYIPEGVKVSFPVMDEVKVPEGGDVESVEDATLFESSGINGPTSVSLTDLRRVVRYW